MTWERVGTVTSWYLIYMAPEKHRASFSGQEVMLWLSSEQLYVSCCASNHVSYPYREFWTWCIPYTLEIIKHGVFNVKLIGNILPLTRPLYLTLLTLLEKTQNHSTPKPKNNNLVLQFKKDMWQCT